MDDVALNKAAIIERCLRRVAEEYGENPDRLSNQTVQDAIVLNLERACQAAIDLAMHAVAREHLGVPQTSAQAFDLLADGGRLDPELAGQMRKMVGFRNVAVHQYQRLDLGVLRRVIETSAERLSKLCAALGVRIDATPTP